MKKLLYVFFFLFTSLNATDIDQIIKEQSVQKDFLIAKSTKSYSEAKKFAKSISVKTHIKYDDNRSYNKEIGLSEDKEVCKMNGMDYPCYFSRGRYDDGVYISIEYSDAYRGFTKGYYMVIVASGADAKSKLKEVQKYVPDAYVKQSSVYMGCVH